ncbi:DEA(D/H)-box RNA helicase family protein [Artemisia annua]|uniref:DEA(D/H)-box RNA helicase family protein n=1 Tax=Artemisia annua TaxID=35608 RepID=A0A2U1M7R7_ARTAN|nr:DEA(D/H)-box RNA helicase family protein [Artemisia annua]
MLFAGNGKGVSQDIEMASSSVANIDEWKWKLSMLLQNQTDQEIVSKDKRDKRDFEQIANLAKRMGLYWPDLDDKRPQREVVIPLSLQRRVEGLLQEHIDRMQLKSGDIASTTGEDSHEEIHMLLRKQMDLLTSLMLTRLSVEEVGGGQAPVNRDTVVMNLVVDVSPKVFHGSSSGSSCLPWIEERYRDLIDNNKDIYTRVEKLDVDVLGVWVAVELRGNSSLRVPFCLEVKLLEVANMPCSRDGATFHVSQGVCPCALGVYYLVWTFPVRVRRAIVCS